MASMYMGTEPSFRCAQAGHVCNGMAPPIMDFSAPLSECKAFDGNGPLLNVKVMADSIKAVKPRPEQQILVSAIVGVPDTANPTYQYGKVDSMHGLDYLPICGAAAKGPTGQATAPLR